VDISLFHESLSCFVGTYDFSSFSHQLNHRTRDFLSRGIEYSTIKTIYSISLVEMYSTGSGYYRIDFKLNSALYHMVRNIVWTCAYVAAGRMSLSDVKALLGPPLLTQMNNGNREGVSTSVYPPRQPHLSMPAPPEGLCLEHVYYADY
jgi:tRNA pseudouridine(38-40) synthase